MSYICDWKRWFFSPRKKPLSLEWDFVHEFCKPLSLALWWYAVLVCLWSSAVFNPQLHTVSALASWCCGRWGFLCHHVLKSAAFLKSAKFTPPDYLFLHINSRAFLTVAVLLKRTSVLFQSFHFLSVICFSLLTIIDQLDRLNGIRDS